DAAHDLADLALAMQDLMRAVNERGFEVSLVYMQPDGNWDVAPTGGRPALLVSRLANRPDSANIFWAWVHWMKEGQPEFRKEIAAEESANLEVLPTEPLAKMVVWGINLVPEQVFVPAQNEQAPVMAAAPQIRSPGDGWVDIDGVKAPAGDILKALDVFSQKARILLGPGSYDADKPVLQCLLGGSQVVFQSPSAMMQMILAGLAVVPGTRLQKKDAEWMLSLTKDSVRQGLMGQGGDSGKSPAYPNAAKQFRISSIMADLRREAGHALERQAQYAAVEPENRLVGNKTVPRADLEQLVLHSADPLSLTVPPALAEDLVDSFREFSALRPAVIDALIAPYAPEAPERTITFFWDKSLPDDGREIGIVQEWLSWLQAKTADSAMAMRDSKVPGDGIFTWDRFTGNAEEVLGWVERIKPMLDRPMQSGGIVLEFLEPPVVLKDMFRAMLRISQASMSRLEDTPAGALKLSIWNEAGRSRVKVVLARLEKEARKTAARQEMYANAHAHQKILFGRQEVESAFFQNVKVVFEDVVAHPQATPARAAVVTFPRAAAYAEDFKLAMDDFGRTNVISHVLTRIVYQAPNGTWGYARTAGAAGFEVVVSGAINNKKLRTRLPNWLTWMKKGQPRAEQARGARLDDKPSFKFEMTEVRPDPVLAEVPEKIIVPLVAGMKALDVFDQPKVVVRVWDGGALVQRKFTVLDCILKGSEAVFQSPPADVVAILKRIARVQNITLRQAGTQWTLALGKDVVVFSKSREYKAQGKAYPNAAKEFAVRNIFDGLRRNARHESAMVAKAQLIKIFNNAWGALCTPADMQKRNSKLWIQINNAPGDARMPREYTAYADLWRQFIRVFQNGGLPDIRYEVENTGRHVSHFLVITDDRPLEEIRSRGLKRVKNVFSSIRNQVDSLPAEGIPFLLAGYVPRSDKHILKPGAPSTLVIGLFSTDRSGVSKPIDPVLVLPDHRFIKLVVSTSGSRMYLQILNLIERAGRIEESVMDMVEIRGHKGASTTVELREGAALVVGGVRVRLDGEAAMAVEKVSTAIPKALGLQTKALIRIHRDYALGLDGWKSAAAKNKNLALRLAAGKAMAEHANAIRGQERAVAEAVLEFLQVAEPGNISVKGD
ncbi:MAG: hypothetical protein HQL19_08455, partial [Candidatus Omnitrophica bacterium]|nr:hypothetical protein [Candidatus Omnitrophota bacterium]